MYVSALGLSHQTAPVAVREKAVFSQESIPSVLADLSQVDSVKEAAILSTCNRTEIYCGQSQSNKQGVLSWLSNHTGLSDSQLQQCIYYHPNESAVKHAFRVASGLDSLVLGEPQILGQMKSAFDMASNSGTTGKILNKLFQQTFNVAKQVRTDTTIGENSVSVAYSGVALAKKLFANLEEQTVLLIGAGETIELVLQHLKKNKVQNIIIANRSISRAQTLANQIGSEAIALSDVPQRLLEADIIVTSTASTLPILGKGMMEKTIKKRKHRPIFILDLAVPRDVEAEVGALSDVYLYTIDDLHSVIDENRAMRLIAAESAEQIIDLQVVKFMRWMRSLGSISTISDFRDKVDRLSQKEMQLALDKLNTGHDPEKVIRDLARSLSNKFSHDPSLALREADMDGNPNIVKIARKLFKL